MRRFARRMIALTTSQLPPEEEIELRKIIAADQALVKKGLKAKKRKLAVMSEKDQARYLRECEQESNDRWSLFTDTMGLMASQEHHDITWRSVIAERRGAPLQVPEGGTASEALSFSLNESEILNSMEKSLPSFMRSKK